MSDAGSSTTAALLRMQGVRKRFGATVALDGVDLHVHGGEVLALVGENGAGKSTLMKILAGAVPPDDGRMWLDDVPYAPRDPADGRAAGVAMIYQELSLAPHLSVAENILLGVEPTVGGVWLKRRQMHDTAASALREVGHGDIPLHLPVGRLNAAQRQVVEIARSIAVGSRVLVFDEPTSSLTQRDIARLFTLIGRLRQRGLGIVYISHFLEEVKQISDRVVVLRDGRVAGSGATADLPLGSIVQSMVGRPVSDLYPRSRRRRGEAVLDVRELSGAAKPTVASLTLHRGEVLGIAGLVGAGRTEMLRAIFGLDAVKSGSLRIGHHRGSGAPHDRWRQGAGMISEDRKGEGLALGRSVAENLTLTRLRGTGPGHLVTPAGMDRAASRWISRLNIRCRSPRQPVGSLSGGNQQKVALARLLHHDCDLLLLDEPTRGIDVAAKAEVYQLIDELASDADRPRAILMISSYLPELLGVCDRIAVMCRGVLGPARDVAELDERGIMAEAVGVGRE